MAIDMPALAKAAEGDPSARVQVNKAWLAEVHRKLEAGAAAENELASKRRSDRLYDTLFGDRRFSGR